MSNSGSAGASGFGRPFLPGCTVEWDDEANQWVATSNTSPGREFRGRNQDELDAARGRLVADLCGEMNEIIQYAATHGYTPPPRT